METSSNIAIILLAAGGSTRLGTPKQLLEIKGEILIQRIYQNCIQSQASSVVVVVGSNSNDVQKILQKSNPILAFNPNWESGIVSSIQIGLKKILKEKPDTEAILIVLCDQYFVDTTLLDSIIQSYSFVEKQAVCCRYDNTIGVPALYPKHLFNNLLKTKHAKGAKKELLKLQEENQLVMVNFPNGIYDIDTLQQLESLKKMLE